MTNRMLLRSKTFGSNCGICLHEPFLTFPVSQHNWSPLLKMEIYTTKKSWKKEDIHLCVNKFSKRVIITFFIKIYKMRLLLVKTVDKNPTFPVDQEALNTFLFNWLLLILIIANNYHYLSLEFTLTLAETESKNSMKG